jgi:hypothetical protein
MTIQVLMTRDASLHFSSQRFVVAKAQWNKLLQPDLKHLGSNWSAEQKPRTSDMDNCAVPDSFKHNLPATEGKGPFEDQNC